MFGRLRAILAVLAVWGLLQAAIPTSFAQDKPDSSQDDVTVSPPRSYRYANSPSSKPGRIQSAPQVKSVSAPTARYQGAGYELPPPGNAGSVPAQVPGSLANGTAVEDPFDDDGNSVQGAVGSMHGHQPMWDDVDGGDGAGCGAPCGPCCGPVYVRVEYLAWFLKGENLPPLVTTSTAGTTRADAGVLGLPSTSIVYGGGNSYSSSLRSGGRIALGWWLDPSARIEGEFFALGQQQSQYDATSAGTPILARPFLNLSTGLQDSNVVAFPGQLSGTIQARATSGSFLGAGIHATQNLTFTDFGFDRQRRLDFLYGFRYLHLQEGLSINDSITSTSTAGTVPIGTNIMTSDNFRTTNNFYGLNMGLMTENRMARWCLTGIGRLGLGATTERISINGNTTVTPAGGAATTSAGGLLALPSNIGTYQHTGFAVVPQLELKLGYDLTPRLRLNVGYDVIYWSRVARPGDQVNGLLNTSQASGQPLVGAAAPTFVLRETDLWVQGFSAGGEFRF